MPYSFPPHVDTISPGSGDASPTSALLTPPITPLSIEDIPYRAADNDNISLNMRKGKNPRARLRCKAQQKRPQRVQEHSNEIPRLDSFARAVVFRSNSMGHMRRHSSVPVSPGSPNAATPPPEECIGKRNRRWTLPSKSAPTRGFTPLRSTVKQATLGSSVESPAMITLRRATTNKSPKRNELTFFPEPKFGNERNGLLSYLVSKCTRTNLVDMAAPLFADGKRSRSSSISSEGAHPTLTYPAATVCTETTVESTLVSSGDFPDKPSARRWSVKYVASNTSYEVIWDENDSSSTQGSSQPSVAGRRPSLAVMKLESQLPRRQVTPRRASGQSSGSPSLASPSSAKQIYAQALTPNKLEQIFPRLLHKTGLRNLPTSRTGRKRRNTVCSITVDQPEQQTLVGQAGRKASTFTIDFFPPLSSTTNCRTSVVQSPLGLGSSSSLFEQRASHSDKGTSPKSGAATTKSGPDFSSMIGSSSHTRRGSYAFIDGGRRRENVAKKLTKRSGEHIPEEQDRESDTAPLLGS